MSPINPQKLPQKTIVIAGPTAAGKSDLAILLAHRYNGEIISADSRQVYRGMDIGTGKVARDHAGISNSQFLISKQSKIPARPAGGKNQKSKIEREEFFSEGVRHHLLDVASPKRSYNVTHFVRDAKKIIADIKKCGKLPIICGGTGFWIQALVEDNAFPAVKPDLKLRERLGKLSTEKLFMSLQKKDPRRAKAIDKHNKVRLIRALEIIATLGKVPRTVNSQQLTVNEKNYIIIALNPDKETLQKNIEIRLKKRLKKGMIAEVKCLHTDGVSWKRLESFGLEYRRCAQYLEKKVSRQDLEALLPNDIWHYAKRQLSFLRRFEKMGATIHWITDSKEAKKLLKSLDYPITHVRV
ncbi:MAG: tRNA (adenosine(37)-N6)-dimethylallyltransferase MiaA [bacterium]|nr:tRNA (adenosine(37)-N6)-dimethylallyltransferase MiaA [bacterium]